MSALAPPRQAPTLGRARTERRGLRRDRCRDGGGLTLERRLDELHGAVLATGAAECPACGGSLVRGVGVEARCEGCKTTLA